MSVTGHVYYTCAELRELRRAAFDDFDARTPVESNRAPMLDPDACPKCDHIHSPRPGMQDWRCWRLQDSGKRCRCGHAYQSRHTNAKFRKRVEA